MTGILWWGDKQGQQWLSTGCHPEGVRHRLETFLVFRSGISPGRRWVEARDAAPPPARYGAAAQQRAVWCFCRKKPWVSWGEADHCPGSSVPQGMKGKARDSEL